MTPVFILFFYRPKKSICRFFRTYRWLLFWLIALIMAPGAYAANVKIGGSNNTLSFISYYALLGGALALRDTAVHYSRTFAGLLARRAIFLYTVILLAVTFPVLFYRFATLPQGPSPAELAYRYAASHPGTSYFPRLTIVHLLAEGKLYHETEGLTDRRWAHLEVTKEQMKNHLPKNLEVIGFAGEDHRQALEIPGFSTGYRDFKDLPGFIVYPKDPEKPA